MKPFFSSITVVMISLLAPSQSQGEEVKEVRFSGGAPLNSYLPRVITPILFEAFKRHGTTFSTSYRPSLRSLIVTNRGEYDGELHRVYNFA